MATNNFTSLSSTLLTQIAESSWWTASRAEPQERSDKTARELLDGVTLRSSGSFHLHNAVSTVARLVATLAIDVFVAPVGLVYHSVSAAKALYEGERAVAFQHEKCAYLELGRVAATVSLVAPPILVWKLGMTPLSLQCMLFGLAMAPYEVFFSIMNPFLTSRRADADEDDAQRIAHAILKWNVGISETRIPEVKYRDLLAGIISESATAMLKQIAILQTKLPGEERLPLPPEGQEPNIAHIFGYLEESRTKLPKEVWDSTEEARKKLAHYNGIFSQLNSAISKISSPAWNFSSPWDKEAVKRAFRPNDDLVLPTRAPPALHIHSFTQTLFVRMLSSNWFYPSNYKPQLFEDKGSIARSMSGIDPCESRQAVEDSHNAYVKEDFRWCARALCGTVIIAIGAPVGTLMHGAQALYHLGVSVLLGGDTSYMNIKKAKAHGYATWNDFTTFFTGWPYPFLDPKTSLSYIATREDRAGLSLSLILKKDFGISGPNGELLTYSADEDVPKKLDANRILNDMFILHSRKILQKKLREYNKLGSEAEKSKMDSAFIWFCRRGIGEGAYKGLKDLRKAIIECFNTTENLDVEKVCPLKLRHFGLEFESFEKVRLENSACETWTERLTKIKNAITHPAQTDSKKQTDYEKLKERILAENVTPASVFGLPDSYTRDDIDNHYERNSLICRPNNNHACKDEAGEVSKFIDSTKAALEEILQKKK